MQYISIFDKLVLLSSTICLELLHTKNDKINSPNNNNFIVKSTNVFFIYLFLFKKNFFLLFKYQFINLNQTSEDTVFTFRHRYCWLLPGYQKLGLQRGSRREGILLRCHCSSIPGDSRWEPRIGREVM